MYDSHICSKISRGCSLFSTIKIVVTNNKLNKWWQIILTGSCAVAKIYVILYTMSTHILLYVQYKNVVILSIKILCVFTVLAIKFYRIYL